MVVVAALGLATWAAKPHVISFGKIWTVKLFLGGDETKSVDIKVRPLMVDGKIKEFTTGEPHDVTDRSFVVQRAFRVNDSLPEEGRVPKWKWQRGGWLTVDRSSARISAVKLPEFDPFYSQAAWYRDYVAYCGVTDNGEKLTAVVSQIGRKKPIYRRELGLTTAAELPDAYCHAPHWERQPMRVTFQPKQGGNFTVNMRGLVTVQPATEPAESDEE